MYEVKVEGMTCHSCASSIGYALKSADPQVDVSVDLKKQTVKVKTTKPQTEITALIEEAGYQVLGVREVA